MSRTRILIVHPDPPSLALLSSMLNSLGYETEESADDRVAARQIDRGGVDVVLVGVEPADPEALELLSFVRRKHRQVPVILLIPSPNPERTREAMRLGALSVLRYPVPAAELRAAVTQALGTITRPEPGPSAHHPPSMATASAFLARREGPGYGRAARPPVRHATPLSGPDPQARDLDVEGLGPSLRPVIELACAIAPTRTPVLIVGGRGTGKALLARTIHGLGSRADQPFVTVDCASMTGAPAGPEPGSGWADKLAQAGGGTLFLDDVGALSGDLQFHLLRALQEHEHRHAPGFHAPRTDVRFLMSAGENLASLVEQGEFRPDLFQRASTVCLKLPPLHHGGADVELVAELFRAVFSPGFGKNLVGFTPDACDTPDTHDRPAGVWARLNSAHQRPCLCHPRSHAPVNIRPLREALDEPEKRILAEALQALNWNRQETARALDINRTTLYKKMKKHGLRVVEPGWSD